MGNMYSCVHPPQSKTAKLVDIRRKTLRLVGVPSAAAELMIEEPGHIISPLNGYRLSAMKADESLIGGGVYVLIPVRRANGKLSESEMADIESACSKRKSKRRSSRILPVVPEISRTCADNQVTPLVKGGDIIGNQLRVRPWKPALEPIYEGL